MLFVWFSMHLGSISMAFWIDFNAFWMGFACFGKDFNAFSIGFQLDLGGISMGLEGISMHFQLIFNGIWMDLQLFIVCLWVGIGFHCSVYGVACLFLLYISTF